MLNRSERTGTRVLLGGANFGGGSSREHAFWGLLQYGIQAVVAPSFGEIFYSNAMGNRPPLVPLPVAQVEVLMDAADAIRNWNSRWSSHGATALRRPGAGGFPHRRPAPAAVPAGPGRDRNDAELAPGDPGFRGCALGCAALAVRRSAA